MDDTGTRQSGRLRVGVQQAVHQRVAPVARGRVGDEPGRLVDDRDVVVLMDDGERHRVRGEGGVALQRLGFDLDGLDALELQGRETDLTVDTHGAQGDPALDAGAGDAFQVWLKGLDQELVEALAGAGRCVKGNRRENGGIVRHTKTSCHVNMAKRVKTGSLPPTKINE